MIQRLFLYFFFFTVLTGSSQNLDELFEKSMRAYNDKQFDRFLTYTQRLDSMRPAHPRITYNLASAYALNKQEQNSINTLKKLVLMNNTASFESDSDFVSLKHLKPYNELSELKKELSKPISSSNKVTELSELDLHPEAILYLPKHKLWLSTSIHKKKIVSFDLNTGNCSDWLTDNGLLSVFAIKASKDEKFLWVSTSAMPEMLGYADEMAGKAEILKVDIASKTIVQRFSTEGNHVFGDLLVSTTNDVYISDSNEPVIYKISNGKNQMEKWLTLTNEGFNLQGLCFNEDETKLFIADYLRGIKIIDMKNLKNTQWMVFPEGYTNKGIDGLVFHKGNLLAIHNGVTPIRIVSYEINQQKNTITKATVIDKAREEFMEPTNGCIYNGQFYFIANSPWSLYQKDMTLDLVRLKKPLLFSYKLK